MKKTKNWKRSIVILLVSLTILFFLLRHIWLNFEQLREYDFSFHMPLLALSLVLWMLSYTSFALAWKYTTNKIRHDSRLTNTQAIRIYMLTDLGKYVPGKIWSVAGRVVLGSELGVEKKSLLVSALLDGVMGVIGVLLLGAVLLTLSFVQYNSYIVGVAIAMVLGGLVFVHPKIFYPFVNWTLQKVGRGTIPADTFLSYSAIIHIFGIYLTIHLFVALSFFVFLSSFTALSWDLFPVGGAAFLLAGGLGLAAVFAPGGFGIREGVMSGILQLVMPLPVAILASLLTRLWTTAGELLLLLGVLLVNRIFNKTRQ